MYWILMLIGSLTASSIIFAQDSDTTEREGRWVPAETFAFSNLLNNEAREHSYSNAERERERILSFLPGMTIVYDAVKSQTRRGYVTGVTHSGIPVQVLEDHLSLGKFSDKDAKDVVIHRQHTVCRNSTCSGERIQVKDGDSFSIVNEDKDKIELINTNELRVFYPKEELVKREQNGYLTRHEGRTNPRWSIHDGYAAKLSTRCGEKTESAGFEIRVKSEMFDDDPSEWPLNDERWSLKAIQIFDVGSVYQDQATDDYIGNLYKTIQDPFGDEIAIDMTVFAYRDSSWTTSYYKFAGILQIVECNKPPIGQIAPIYVKEAYLYFDKRAGDDYIQTFPLTAQELPRQFTEDNQKELYSLVNRSFFYSINSADDYAEVFHTLSDIVPFPIAVSNVIARLNASCNENERSKCSEHSVFAQQATLVED